MHCTIELLYNAGVLKTEKLQVSKFRLRGEDVSTAKDLSEAHFCDKNLVLQNVLWWW